MRLKSLWKPLLTQLLLSEAHRNGLPIELESDSISGWNLTQAYNNRLDLGAYRTYYKGFTCFFNNTVLRGAGLNGCAIFVRKYWDRTVLR